MFIKLINLFSLLFFSATTPTNTLPRHGNNSINNSTEQEMVNRNIAYNQNSCSNSDLVSSIRDIPCTLQNCDLNTNNCSLIRSSSSLSSNGGGIIGGTSAVNGCYSAPSTMKMNQHQQTSNQSLAQILATNQSTQNLYEQYFDCMNTGGVQQTILPPPLFDNSCTANYGQCYEMQNHAGNYCTLSAIEMPKMSSSSSKRLHRTIPKHFTMSSASSSTILGGNEIPQTHQQQQQQQQQQQHQANTSISRNGSTSSSSDNKKPTCQCPVQHVPMTYMTSQFSGQPTQQQQSQSQEIQMQQLQPTQNYSQSHQRHQHSSMYVPSSSSNSKKNNVIKSTTFPSAMNASSANGKIQTIANAELMMSTEVMSQGIHHEMSSNNSGGGTLRRSHKTSSSSSAHSNNSSGMPVTPNKKSIATISVATTQASASGGPYFTTKVDSKQHQPQQIHSILKNKNHSGCHVNVINVTDPSVGGGTVSEPNPILPPKMYKNSNKYSTTSNGGSGGGSKQIHTITRPNELTTTSSQFSLLAINSPGGNSQKYQHQQLQLQQQQQSSQFQHPQQLRTNIQVGLQCCPMEYHPNFNKISLQGTLYNTKSLPRGGFVCEDGSKNRLSFSGTSSSHHQPPQLQHQQLQQQSVTQQSYSTNTLPKNHNQQQPASQQIYGKAANPSRSMITDVVNKVPSVIMLPIPQQQPQQGAQMILKTVTPSNSLLKMSTSKNNISNDSVDGSVVETGSSSGCHSHNSTLKRSKQKRDAINVNEKVISSKGSVSSASSSTQISSSSGVVGGSDKHSGCGKFNDKPLPILTTTTNCTNPKEHFLPNDTSLDDDYLSECENCKTAGSGSRYYLDDEELDELPLQETMTLQRKLINQSGMDPMNDENDQQNYYRVSSTLPTNTNKKIP